MLSNSKVVAAGEKLGCNPAAVWAVADVETPLGSFDGFGLPRILFEGHVFHRLTGGKFSLMAPTISYPRWTRQYYARGPSADARNAGEHARLQAAVALNRAAALMSASWGGFQILGENFAQAGHPSLQSFINAMFSGDDQHLEAFVEFVMHDARRHPVTRLTMHQALVKYDWPSFAYLYNGSGYRENKYDEKLDRAFILRNRRA